METTTARELILLVLLVKILVAAAIASIMARFAYFKNLLFLSDKNPQQRLQFGVVLGAPLMAGAALRIILQYQAPDLGMEGAILAGVLGGAVAGAAAGGLAAFPALFHQEALALPFLMAAGALGGYARHLAASKDDIWHFSPFFDLNLYR